LAANEVIVVLGYSIIAELWRPKGRQAEPHTHHGKEKETHELIFSWLSWAAVLLMGAYARQRRSCPTWRPFYKKETALVHFFDIGHPYYNQLTPVKTRYPLTSIT